MTRRRVFGAAAVAALGLVAAGALVGPDWAEEQIAAAAAERGVELSGHYAQPTSLTLVIPELRVERSGFALACTAGSASTRFSYLLGGEGRLHRLSFQRCALTRSGDAPNEGPGQGPAESESRLERAFGALDSLLDVEHLRIDEFAVELDEHNFLLENLRGQTEPASFDIQFFGRATAPLNFAGDVRVQANPDAVTVTADAPFELADASIEFERAGITPDGYVSASNIELESRFGSAALELVQLNPERAVVVEGARLSLATDGDRAANGQGAEASASDAGGTEPSESVAPLSLAEIGVPVDRLQFDESTTVDSFVRGLLGGGASPAADPEPAEAETETNSLMQRALDSAGSVSLALHSLRDGVESIPLDLSLSDIVLNGVPGCEDVEIHNARIAPGEVIGHVECDGMSLLLTLTAESTVASFARLDVGRLHPVARGLVNLTIRPTSDEDSLNVEVESSFTDLGLSHDAVSPAPVELTGAVDLTLTLRDGDAESPVDLEVSGRLGAVPLDGTISASHNGSAWNLRAEGGVSEPTPCSTMWEAAPAGLTPHLRHANVSFTGSAAPRLRATYEVGNSDSFDMRQDGFMGDCEIESIDEPYDPRVLLEEDYVFTVVEHATVPIDVGPGAYGYLTMDELPSFIPALMHLSEEIAFFDNPGVSMMLMRRAVRMNLRESRYVYGGSTVTQQLAKNLFFDREKTLARKFEEAIVVWAMEQWVPKERILELYLNCVEFAPDVYGITQAARHYFDKHPSELTPVEAAFLAALKPAPSRGERHRRRGHSPDTGWWHERLQVLLQRLVEYGPYIAQSEVDHYAPYVVVFPTSPNFSEVEVEVMHRPKGATVETFTEARARLSAR